MPENYYPVAAFFGALLPICAVIGAASSTADPVRCTNQINYAGDPRSNAVINSIGASTGICPVPIPQAYGLPGLVDGAIQGQPCYNYPAYIFGQAKNGNQFACLAQGDGTGIWVRSIPVIGVRQIGGPCSDADTLAAQTPLGRPLVCGSGQWTPNDGLG